jgi:hypothetical protein
LLLGCLIEQSHGSKAEAAQAVRLEFPTFNGEDPEKWCSCAARYFDFYGTRDAQRLSISSLHMDGKADVWFREVNATHTVPRWDDFVQALLAQFSAPAKVEHLEEFRDEEEEQSDDEANPTLIPVPDPADDTKRTTNPATEPAEDPKHAKITAADPVDDSYHLFDEIPPRISKSFLERPFPDPAVPYVIILESINHTVSSLVPHNSNEDGVDFVVLKHRWRWKEEEDATRAGRGRRHCCLRSRARQETGGPRSRARGRRDLDRFRCFLCVFLF